MNQIKSIFKNMSWMTSYKIVFSVCAFLWTIILARYLGVAGYGLISFATAFTNLTKIIINLGTDKYLTREVARYKETMPKFINNILPLKTVLSIVLLIFTGLVLYLLGYSNLTILVTLIFSVDVILSAFALVFASVFQAYEDMKYQSIGGIILSLIVLGGAIGVVIFKLDIISVAIVYVLGDLFYLLFLLSEYLIKFKLPKFEFDFKFWIKTIKKSIPFGLTSFFYLVYFSIDMVMISYIVGDYATGIYRSAYNLINMFTTIYTVYSLVIFPVMSKFFVESKNLIKVTYEQSVKYLLIFTLPICMGTFLYAEPILTLIYTSKYAIAAAPLQILIWTVPFLFVNGAATLMLNAINKEVKVTQIYIIASLFNIGLNLILIQLLSYKGAAISTVVSAILVYLLGLYYIFKTEHKPDNKLIKIVSKIVVSTLVLGIILYILNLSLWLAIPVGLVIYLIMLFITKTPDEADKYIIKELLNKNK